MKMFVRVLSLIYLFLVRCRFPFRSSVSDIVRGRYGDQVVAKVRKYEKLDYKVGKSKLDITFLEVCLEHDVMPTFVQFRTANKTLKNSESYSSCQRILLTQERDNKRLKQVDQTQALEALKAELRDTLSSLDFLFISSLFLEKNRRVLQKVEQSQNDKLSKMLEDQPVHEADDLIFNYSNHELTPAQISILMKGLNFALPPKKLRHEDYLLNFELLYRNAFESKSVKPDELDEFKNKLRSLSLQSLKFYNRKKKKLENISEDEHNALLELASLNDIVIQKADKGNVIVLVNKSDYIEKMEAILSDTSKFELMNFERLNGDLRHLLDKEEEVKNFLKDLRDKKIISDQDFIKLVPIGSSPGVLYGLCKVHKNIPNGSNCPPFRPILSAIGTVSYNLAKFLVPILEPLTKNQYVCKDSFSFAADVREQNPDLYMASFDVDSLFTNIPLDETIEICVKKLFGRKHKFKGFNRSEFRSLLQFAVKDNLILFNGKYYIQIDGVAMGSPLGPTLANVFLCHWEGIWLEKCPKQFRPLYYRRYVDDTFLLFASESHVKKFLRYLNSRHDNMNFTFETEVDNKLPFLDVLVTRVGSGFTTSLYRKPTFSGLYTNFNSFISEKYKTGLIYCLLFRIFTLTVDWTKFHEEVKFLSDTFRKNQYPQHFFDRCVKMFLDRRLNPDTGAEIEKEELVVSLPFVGKYSNDLKKKLKALASTYLQSKFKISVVWSSSRKLRSFFTLKERLPMHLRSKILYRFTCDGCNSIYIGKSKRHFLVRAFEHLGKSYKTGKGYTYNPTFKNNTAVWTHLNHSKGCSATLDSFELIGSARNDFFLKIKESLLIKKIKPTLLNPNGRSIPLYLFD